MVKRLYEEFQDYKIQDLRTLLVHQLQHEQQVHDLTAAKESQGRQIELLQRSCQALEDKFMDIKKNTMSNKAIQTDKPQPTTHQSSTTGQHIHTTINSGRYTTTTPSSQHPPPPPSTTSHHAPTPPNTGDETTVGPACSPPQLSVCPTPAEN